MIPNAVAVGDRVYCSVDGDQPMTPVEAEALAAKLLAEALAARGEGDIESDPIVVADGLLIRVDFPDGDIYKSPEHLTRREARVLVARLLRVLA